MDEKRIKELLKKCKGNRTGKEFAAQVGISEAHMSKILSVKNIPKPSTIEKIIEASPNSGISLNELLTAFEYSAIIQEYSSFEKELNIIISILKYLNTKDHLNNYRLETGLPYGFHIADIFLNDNDMTIKNLYVIINLVEVNDNDFLIPAKVISAINNDKLQKYKLLIVTDNTDIAKELSSFLTIYMSKLLNNNDFVPNMKNQIQILQLFDDGNISDEYSIDLNLLRKANELTSQYNAHNDN